MGMLGQSTMSQEETKQNFDFERKKHFDFFIPFYNNQNWQVNKDNINSNQKNDWDVELEIYAGQYVRADEKAIRGQFNNCLIELIQDMQTGSLGWYFGKKDWILYGIWGNPEKIEPTELYKIQVEKLDEYIYGLEGFIKTCISKKGWGITWNLVLDWYELVNKNIATKLL